MAGEPEPLQDPAPIAASLQALESRLAKMLPSLMIRTSDPPRVSGPAATAATAAIGAVVDGAVKTELEKLHRTIGQLASSVELR